MVNLKKVKPYKKTFLDKNYKKIRNIAIGTVLLSLVAYVGYTQKEMINQKINEKKTELIKFLMKKQEPEVPKKRLYIEPGSTNVNYSRVIIDEERAFNQVFQKKFYDAFPAFKMVIEYEDLLTFCARSKRFLHDICKYSQFPNKCVNTYIYNNNLVDGYVKCKTLLNREF